MSALVRVAKVDHDQVYWGLGAPIALEAVKAGDFVFGAAAVAASLPEGAVYIAEDCDLAGGRYRFAAPDAHHAVWHLVPLAGAVKSAPDAITAERAFYEQLARLHAQAPQLVAPVAMTWACLYEQSVDADEGRRFNYFRALAEGSTA